MDGGHPGNFGHAVVASELLEKLRVAAAAPASKSFGGVHMSDLGRSKKDLLEKIRATDEAIIGADKNQ